MIQRTLNLSEPIATRVVLFEHAPDTQKISSTVMGISEETYQTICKEIDALKKKIRTLVENETDANRVFLYQSVLVPLTK